MERSCYYYPLQFSCQLTFPIPILNSIAVGFLSLLSKCLLQPLLFLFIPISFRYSRFIISFGSPFVMNAKGSIRCHISSLFVDCFNTLKFPIRFHVMNSNLNEPLPNVLHVVWEPAPQSAKNVSEEAKPCQEWDISKVIIPSPIYYSEPQNLIPWGLNWWSMFSTPL